MNKICTKKIDIFYGHLWIKGIYRKYEKICAEKGNHDLGKQEAKIASLGSKRRLNWIFHLMGVVYEDRPILEGKDVKDAGKVFSRLANDRDTPTK